MLPMIQSLGANTARKTLPFNKMVKQIEKVEYLNFSQFQINLHCSYEQHLVRDVFFFCRSATFKYVNDTLEIFYVW